MDASIRIRGATRDDVGAIVRFNQGLASETEDTELASAVLTSGINAVFDDASKGFYLVAELDGRPAGCLLITTEWSDWRDGYIWWIQSVYVDPEHRRRGVYSALHDAVVRKAASRRDVRGIRLYVDRDNARARRTYQRLGMTPSRYDLYEQSVPSTPPSD